MKTNEQILAELKMTLGAIKITRARWLEVLTAKMAEAKSYRPEPSDQAAFSAALGMTEVHEAHQNLVNLYGILGTQAEEFEKSLEQVVDAVPAHILKVA